MVAAPPLCRSKNLLGPSTSTPNPPWGSLRFSHQNLQLGVLLVANTSRPSRTPSPFSLPFALASAPPAAMIYSVYETLKNKTTPGASSSSSSSGSSIPEPSDEKKKEADALKSKGNAAMAQKDYKSAIDLYTQALSIHPRNA
ncbi:unnamed protein product, partial [Clonostachys rosea]